MKIDLKNRYARIALPLTGLSVFAAVLSGCGGASTSNSPIVATPDSGPVIYGINALAQSTGAIASGETSSLTFTPTGGTQTGAIVGAITYKAISGAGALPAYKSAFPATGTSDAGVPLGFGPGGLYFNTTAAVSAVPTTGAGNLVFGIYVSQGAKGGNLVDINPSSIVLTSTEAPSFSQPIVFDPNAANSTISLTQYKTAPFAVPAFMQTTGLHDLHAVIADTAGQSSATDFDVLTLAPTDSAALVTITFTSGPTTLPVPGASVTITNALPTVAAYKDATAPTGAAALPATTSYTDAQGVGIVFAQPGPQTITINGIDPIGGTAAITGTATVTLVAGQANATINIAAVKATTTPTAAAIARVKMMAHHTR